jgi:hypothetical protein
MKTGLDMVKDGFTLLNVDVVNNAITGKVYMFIRPKNSLLQDVVLNTLAITNDQLQQGVFNVNIHCPNLTGVVIEGVTDNTQPDITSLTNITNIILSIVADYVGADFKIWAQNTGLLIRDVDGTWYVNVRVNYLAFQQNFINI